MRTLRGKRVLITGAAQGIGRMLALNFARAGAKLVIADLREDLLPGAAEEVRIAGGEVVAYPLDVTDRAAIDRLRDRLGAEVGPIDVLVNNAGLVFGGEFLAVPWARHERTYAVNVGGVVAMTHAFLPELIARPEAALVNIASASGFIGLPFGSTYASSKWAVIGFSESIRLELDELGHRHVKVTTVCPSYVSTGLFAGVQPPRGTQMLRPDRLAQKIVRGVERERLFVLEPPLVHLTPFLAGVLPRRWFDRVGRFFGVNTTMRSWRGRETATAAPAPANAPQSAEHAGR